MIDDWSPQFYDAEHRLNALGYHYFAEKAQRRATRWLYIIGGAALLVFEVVRELATSQERFPQNTRVMLVIGIVTLPLAIWRAIVAFRDKACYESGRIPDRFPAPLPPTSQPPRSQEVPGDDLYTQ